MFKKPYCSLILLVLYACTKDVNISGLQIPDKVIVNCMFNPDSSWKVFVGKSGPSATPDHSPLPNATVLIARNSENPISLELKDGYYVSVDKPLSGGRYRLKVIAPGYDTVFAESYIPETVTISKALLDTENITTIIPDNAFDYIKVHNLQLSFTQTKFSDDCMLQFRGMVYPPQERTIYYISSRSIDEMRVYGWDSKAYEELAKLINVPFYGLNQFNELVTQKYIREMDIYVYESSVEKRPMKPEEVIYADNNFFPIESFPKDPASTNILGDFQSIFIDPGAIGTNNSINIWVSNTLFYRIATDSWTNTKQDNQYFVQILSLSKEAYQYQTTYIKQQLNAGNPFGSASSVYSNIQGGAGIFAGYTISRVRVL